MSGEWTAERCANLLAKAKRSPSGWKACCPAHEDTDPSLFLADGQDGLALVCYAGCEYRAIAERLESRGAVLKHSRDRSQIPLEHFELGPYHAFWDYRDASGRVLMRVCRWEQPGRRKDIRPLVRTLDGWKWAHHPTPRPLFQLDRLANEPDLPVMLVEGEKTAAAAQRLFPGFIATTWSGGAAAMGQADFEPLRGRDALLVPDCDTPGRKAMAWWRKHLKGHARSVRILDPSRIAAPLPEGWDLADALAEKRDVSHWLERLEAVAEEQETESEAWPDPVNILSELAAPPFTGEELPEVLAEYPLAYAKATGFDPSITLAAALAVAAAALSDEFQIVGDSASQWFQKPILWVLTIARPGAGKTPAQRELLTQLWDIQRRLREQYACALKALQERKAKAEGDEHEEPPPLPRVILADTTIEALSEALKDNPRGLLIANDEFESWLGGLDAYRRGAVSRDRGEWLRCFDGGPHQVERIQRGSVYVPNWGASILTATTPAALSKLARHLPEDGLLQRFIPIVGRTKTEPQPVEGLEALRQRFHETIERLYRASPRAHKGCVPFSLEAREFLQAWLRQHQLRQEAFGTLEPALESHLAKYPNLLLRIALTLHAAAVVNHQSELARDPAAFPVPLTTLERAARFLKRASLHALALYLNRAGGSEPYELARETGRAILARAWPVLARRNLIQGVRAFRGASPELQDSTLRLLVDLGWLREAEGGYLKATPARYAVNPKLAEKFAETARRERERREVIRAEIAAATQMPGSTKC